MTTHSVRVDEPAGHPWSSSQSGPSRPSRNAARAAVSACRQVDPQAVTCSHGESRGARCERRSGDAARFRRAPTGGGRPAGGQGAALQPHRAATGRAMSVGEAIARSPPAETQPPEASSSAASSTAIALTTPFRSSKTPGGARSAGRRCEPRRHGRDARGREAARSVPALRNRSHSRPRREPSPASGREPRLSAGRRRAPRTAPRQTRADQNPPTGGVVDAAQLAGGDEPAEARVALLEEPPDRPPLRIIGSGNEHLAPHRPEPEQVAHETPVDPLGGDCAGATWPPEIPLPLSARWNPLGTANGRGLPWAWLGTLDRAASSVATNAAPAATAATRLTIAALERARLDPRLVHAGSDSDSRVLWTPESMV